MKRLTFKSDITKGFLTKMNDDFVKCFQIGQGSVIILDLARWFLEFAEYAQKNHVTEEFVADWYCRGMSNAFGNSFNEKYKVDPLKVLLSLPYMSKYASYFEAYISNAALLNPKTNIDIRWSEYKRNKAF
jgi:hypothetical protein